MDVTDTVHKTNRFMAERIASIVGLDIAGIDVISPTLEQPVKKVGGAVIEVNAAPGLRMHLEPAVGRRRNVAAPIMDMLFPKGAPHDIGIVAVTGTNGKTTTVRLIAHIMEHAGYSVGMTTTDGIYVRGNLIAEGDMSGPYSAQVVLRDPLVDCAVLETARGGILRSGLGYKTADVGVVLNVQPDHLGMQNIRDLDELAKVKAVVAEAVREGGTTVLNADDPKCVEMLEYCRENVVFFSLRSSNPVVLEHVDRGNAAVVCEQGYIAVMDGDHLIPVARVEDVPLTMGGKAAFNIQNALAATAAAYAHGVDVDEIRRGLISFLPSPLQTPGRLNLMAVNGVDYLLDFAHNPHAYKNLLELVVAMGDRRRIIVFDVVGDRRDEDIEEVCRLAAPVFDVAVLYEAEDLRGREPGALMELQRLYLTAAGFDEAAIDAAGDEHEAIRRAAATAQPGDLVCYMTGHVHARHRVAARVRRGERADRRRRAGRSGGGRSGGRGRAAGRRGGGRGRSAAGRRGRRHHAGRRRRSPRRRRRRGRRVTRGGTGWKLLIGGSAPEGLDPRLVRRFIELAGGPAAARLAVVPSASEEVPETVALYRESFGREGVDDLMVLDPRSREEADAPGTVRKLAEATGVLFTGGDQLRLLEIFSGAQFMAALRQRIREGIVVGGSSAGAMAMGDPTIVRGEPTEFYEDGAIRHAPGLGLIPRVSVDTHFVVRGRLPRLVSVAAAYPDIVGLGIEENSGVQVSPEGVATVLGDGVVCVVEGAGRGALPARAGHDRALSCAGLTVHVLAAGGELRPARAAGAAHLSPRRARPVSEQRSEGRHVLAEAGPRLRSAPGRRSRVRLLPVEVGRVLAQSLVFERLGIGGVLHQETERLLHLRRGSREPDPVAG